MATARGDVGEGGGARGVGLLLSTDEAGSWPARLTEDEWYARLHARYVRPAGAAHGGAREAALLLYRAGARLQWMTRFCCTPEKAYYKPIRLTGCALGLRCPDSSHCTWCSCALWPCACGGEQRVTPPRAVPRGPTRRAACGGRGLASRLQRAAAEGCLCPLRAGTSTLCPADRLDFMCDKGRELFFEARRRMRQVAEARARDLGIWQEDFEAEYFEHRGKLLRSVATQVAMEPDDETLFVGEGRFMRGRPELRRQMQRARDAGAAVNLAAGAGDLPAAAPTKKPVAGVSANAGNPTSVDTGGAPATPRPGGAGPSSPLTPLGARKTRARPRPETFTAQTLGPSGVGPGAVGRGLGPSDVIPGADMQGLGPSGAGPGAVGRDLGPSDVIPGADTQGLGPSSVGPGVVGQSLGFPDVIPGAATLDLGPSGVSPGKTTQSLDPSSVSPGKHLQGLGPSGVGPGKTSQGRGPSGIDPGQGQDLRSSDVGPGATTQSLGPSGVGSSKTMLGLGPFGAGPGVVRQDLGPSNVNPGATTQGLGPSSVGPGAATQGLNPFSVGPRVARADSVPFIPGEALLASDYPDARRDSAPSTSGPAPRARRDRNDDNVPAEDVVHEIEVTGLTGRGRIGIIDFDERTAAVEDGPGGGLTVYDIRGVKFSLEELPSRSGLKWDAITRNINIKM